MRFLIAFLLIATPALAQQQPPDPKFMERAIQVLQTQRNQALDGQAAETARAAGLTEDLAKAQAEVKRLTEKYEPPKAEQK